MAAELADKQEGNILQSITCAYLHTKFEETTDEKKVVYRNNIDYDVSITFPKFFESEIFNYNHTTNIGPTYREVAAESRKTFAMNKAAYKIESETIRDEIRAIKNKRLELNKEFLSLESKARWRPEEAMSDCKKYLEKLRQEERSEKTISTRSPSAVAAATIASIPAFASLLTCESFYSEDEEGESSI